MCCSQFHGKLLFKSVLDLCENHEANFDLAPLSPRSSKHLSRLNTQYMLAPKTQNISKYDFWQTRLSYFESIWIHAKCQHVFSKSHNESGVNELILNLLCLKQRSVIQYSDVIMSAIASQITGVLIVYTTVCSDADQRKISKLHIIGLCEGTSPVTG